MDTTTPDARRVAHRRVGAAATAAFVALLALGALHQSADADTSTATPTPALTQQSTPSTPSAPNGGGSSPGDRQPTPGGGGGRFWHHRGGSVPDPSGVAPSAPSAPSTDGGTLDGSTT